IAGFLVILSGVLSGDVFGPEVRTDKMSEESGIIGPGISHTFAAIDIAAFQDVDAFRERMAEEIRTLKSGKKAEGVQEIFVPGEIEAWKEERAEREGLWLSKSTFQNLCLLSEEYGTGIDPRDHIRT
ncbi:MAG: Ldh family oxidoreductase, partial [Lachnospiraceae bacterium]|nr:Ldh family oxidoreductase [Lachnospiraceae bacterium]